MAVDVSKLSYKVYLLRENGEQLDVTNISSGVSWEENDGELAVRLSVTLANCKHGGSYISSIAKPNCYLLVYCESGGSSQEVARCKITEWEPKRSGGSDEVSLSGYDELFDLQKSHDNRYVKDGTGTDAVMKGIFSDWGIPIAKYDGPTTACSKTTYKNQCLSDILLVLLDDAHKHGAPSCHIRAVKGKVNVLLKGSNETIYCFSEDENIETTSFRISTSEMVTVVKVVASKEDDDGRQAVEAIVNGKTEYGKRQVIYNRSEDDDLATAKAAANQILEEDGKPTQSMSVKAPDIPYIRKWDKVKITTRAFSGMMLVTSIQHDVDSRTMTMDIVEYDAAEIAGKGEPVQEAKKAESTSGGGEIKKGDIVNFAGGYHYYTSVDGSPRGGLRTAGKAWVQNIAPSAPHKYALIGGAYRNGVGGSSNVYGWVDAGLVSK